MRTKIYAAGFALAATYWACWYFICTVAGLR